MRAFRLATLLAGGLASSAAAQPKPPSGGDPLAAFGIHVVEPMSPEQTAAMRAAVDRELARDGAAQAFDNVTDRNGGAVKHRASGLKCPLGSPGASVQVLASDEVVCRTRDGDNQYETRLARAPASATLQSVYDQTLAQVRQEPGFSAFRGPSIEGRPNPGSGLPDHRTLRFFTRVDGRTRFTRLQVGVVGGWVLSERRTGPEPRGGQLDMGEMLSEATFGSNLPRGSASGAP